MHYGVVVFGVKDTTEMMVAYISNNICKVDLIISIDSEISKKNEISGYKGLDAIAEQSGCAIFKAESYSLDDVITQEFVQKNSFDIGISMGWQRLIPISVLERFQYGIFGFHGSCGYLPYGRGRSPLNWSIINGDKRFILNLFKYDEKADSPNIFAKEMFSITEHDTIRTAQYKNMICAKHLVNKLLRAYENRYIEVNFVSKDFDTWFSKRTQEDGLIDFGDKTRNIYNLIRGISYPFPGAYGYIDNKKVYIWEAHPFDETLDFSMYRPGEVIDIYDNKLIIRTVDGSLLIDDYDCDFEIKIGNVFERNAKNRQFGE